MMPPNLSLSVLCWTPRVGSGSPKIIVCVSLVCPVSVVRPVSLGCELYTRGLPNTEHTGSEFRSFVLADWLRRLAETRSVNTSASRGMVVGWLRRRWAGGSAEQSTEAMDPDSESEVPHLPSAPSSQSSVGSNIPHELQLQVSPWARRRGSHSPNASPLARRRDSHSPNASPLARRRDSTTSSNGSPLVRRSDNTGLLGGAGLLGGDAILGGSSSSPGFFRRTGSADARSELLSALRVSARSANRPDPREVFGPMPSSMP